VIDGKTGKVTTTIAVGRALQEIAFDTASSTAYVANMFEGSSQV
jgi:DNA-binding beta-propeller fold protein YncE